MSRHREEHLELCAAYALGALEGEDRRALEQHLAEGCAQCEAALRDYSAGLLALAASATPAQPSPALRERLLKTARGEGPSRSERGTAGTEQSRRVLKLKPRRERTFIAWGWAAAAALLIVLNALMWNGAQRLRDQLAARQAQLQQLQQRLAEEQRWAAVLSAPGARVALLRPTPQGDPALKARATYDPATQRAVLVFENFTPPSGQDYELWAIRPSGPASLGLIKADAGGRALLKLENAGDPASLTDFAVSLERAGGSPNPKQPSGPVVMLGKLAG